MGEERVLACHSVPLPWASVGFTCIRMWHTLFAPVTTEQHEAWRSGEAVAFGAFPFERSVPEGRSLRLKFGFALKIAVA